VLSAPSLNIHLLSICTSRCMRLTATNVVYKSADKSPEGQHNEKLTDLDRVGNAWPEFRRGSAQAFVGTLGIGAAAAL